MTSASEIAEEFKMCWTTLMYINNLALASYFKELLYSKIKISLWFVILFDKNMDKITQQWQLDYSVRFWNKKKSVDGRYLTSKFLDYSSASDFVHLFEHCEVGLFTY